jgi:hypothetical protein
MGNSITTLEYTCKHIARKLDDWLPLVKFSLGSISDGPEAPRFLDMMLTQQGWDVLKLDFYEIEKLDLFTSDEYGGIDFVQEIRTRLERLAQEATTKAKPIILVSSLDLLMSDYYQPFIDIVQEGFKLPLKNPEKEANSTDNMQLFAPVFFTTRFSFGDALDRAMGYDFLYLDKYSIRDNRFVMKFLNEYEQNIDKLVEQKQNQTQQANTMKF